MRKEFAIVSIVILALISLLSFWYEWPVWLFAVMAPLLFIGIKDSFQKKHAIQRNFPIFGHFRQLKFMLKI